MESLTRYLKLIFVVFGCGIACALRAAPFLTISSPTTNFIVNAAEFAALPHTKIKLMDPHEKKAHRFSGVAVSELLARAGAPSGEKLRGHALRLIVIFRARDGYAVSFSLADFDADYSNRTIFLADEEDGAPLSATAGPLRLIVPGDKKAARWER
ncbi:MAG TPA: molybdopterin-dependent oxidoreductase, partial [Verrucomicrobiae bacterium]